MERYSLIVVSDETAPIRRFDVQKKMVRRALQGEDLAAVIDGVERPVTWLCPDQQQHTAIIAIHFRKSSQSSSTSERVIEHESNQQAMLPKE